MKENKVVQILDKSSKNSHILQFTCVKCGKSDILHEEKEGRGLPPKSWVRNLGDNRKISWSGIWDVWTCNGCGETWRKLRR